MNEAVQAHFEVLGERFRVYHGDPWIERLHTGCRWTEGPAYWTSGSSTSPTLA